MSLHQNSEIKQGFQAVVIGGSMAGLLAARVLLNHFDRVVLIEHDRLPDQPQPRPGVPQSAHVHVLLTQGQRLLEQLFPGLLNELSEAGAPLTQWTKDWLFLGTWGWFPRSPSHLVGYTCSRVLLEWLIRRRLKAYDTLTILEGCQAKGLLANADRSQITGVTLRWHDSDESASSRYPESISADLVVDASGRNSALPKWLTALGYDAPEETVINSFLGYASRWYRRPSNLEVDWQGITMAACPGECSRGGVLYPIEGDRWVVTLAGIGRDYPSTNEAEFLEFARSLRDPVLYKAIADAEPLSPIYAYRRTENRLRHYEKLDRLPEGIIAIGDAACAFNPVYGQGMTVAALGADLLDRCLTQRIPHSKSASRQGLNGLPRQFHKRLAHLVATPWLMATGEDGRWETTEGSCPSWVDRLMQSYLDRVILRACHDLPTYQTFAEVIHMVKAPSALFQPNILFPVLATAWKKMPGKTASS